MKRVLALSLLLCAGWGCLLSIVLVPAAAQDENAVAALREDQVNPSKTPASASAAPAAPGGDQSYTIVSGDWLTKIAQRFYGSASKWTLIYNANKDKLGPNPDLIYPGVTIKIPKDDGTNTGTGTTTPPDPGPATGPGGGTPNPGGNSGPFSQQRPVDHGTITSNFGPRSSPGGIGSTYHEGVDIGVPTGTSVKATGPGRVIFAGVSGGYGNLVKIAFADGTVTYFGHLQSFTCRVGDQVAAGQQVALSNNTGNSTGPHLHFGVEKNGRFVNPRDNFNFPSLGSSF